MTVGNSLVGRSSRNITRCAQWSYAASYWTPRDILCTRKWRARFKIYIRDRGCCVQTFNRSNRSTRVRNLCSDGL